MIPHSPRITLGIPANNSTKVPMTVRELRGASSVRNSAIATEIGVAKRSAPNELTTVP